MRKIYDLRNDKEFVKGVQTASLHASDYGLQTGLYGVLGSDDWWKAIEKGDIPIKIQEGILSRLEGYHKAIDPMERFFIKSADKETEWLIPGNRWDDYVVGRRMLLHYVIQRRKNKLFLQDNQESKIIVGIWMQEFDGYIWSDAWVLLSIEAAAYKTPATITDIKIYGDALNHAWFEDKELTHGFRKLLEDGLIRWEDEKVALTEDAQQIIAVIREPRRSFIREIEALCKVFNIQPLEQTS